jgi:group I intron endonuclease
MITLNRPSRLNTTRPRYNGIITELEAQILHPVERIYTIYKLTCNSTKRAYIGCTSNLNNRLWSHIWYSKHPEYRDGQSAIAKAIREYGIEDFDLEILDTSDDKEFAFNTMEVGYIEMHQTYLLGYNNTKGGIGGWGHQVSAEQRKVMRLTARKSGFKKNNRAGRKMRGRGWITNGVASRKLQFGEKIPSGWRAGRTIHNRFKKAA